MGRCRPCESAAAVGAAAEGTGCISVTGAGTDASPFEVTLAAGCLPVIACTSGTRPSSPAEGQEIFETDTGHTRIWNGSIWKLLNPIAVDADQVASGAGGTFASGVTVGYPGPFTLVTLTITEPFNSGDPFVALVSGMCSAIAAVPSPEAWDVSMEFGGSDLVRGRYSSPGNAGFQASHGPVTVASLDGSSRTVHLKIEGQAGATDTLSWTGDPRFTNLRAACFAL